MIKQKKTEETEEEIQYLMATFVRTVASTIKKKKESKITGCAESVL